MKILIKNILALGFLFIGYVIVFGTPTISDDVVTSIDICNMDLSNYTEPIADVSKPSDTLPCFYEILGQYESGGNYKSVNTLGYLGKYQFGLGTLKWIGFTATRSEFLNNPDMQERAVRKYVAVNRKLLEPYILKYSNKYFTTVNGTSVYVTESGILGGAHLGGHGSVKKFFDTNGRVNNSDAYGTSVLAYIETFSQTKI